MNFSMKVLSWIFDYLAKHGYSIQTYIKGPIRHRGYLNYKRQFNISSEELGISRLVCKLLIAFIGPLHGNLFNHGYLIKTHIQMPIACYNRLVFERQTNSSIIRSFVLATSNQSL